MTVVLDRQKLLGFRIASQTTKGKIGEKGGVKSGLKVGTKLGVKSGAKPTIFG